MAGEAPPVPAQAQAKYVKYLERTVAEHELQIMELQSSNVTELASLREVLERREETLRVQAVELETLRGGLAPRRLMEVQALQDQVRKLKGALRTTTAEACERVQAAEEAAAAERGAAADCKSQLETAQASTRALQRQCDELERQRASTGEALSAEQRRARELEDESSRLAGALSRCLGSLDRLRSHVAATDAATAGREATSSAQNKQIEALQARLASAASAAEAGAVQRAQLEGEVARLKAALFDEMQARKLDARAVATVRNTEADLAATEERLRAVQEELEASRAAARAAAETATARIATLEARVAELEGMVQTLARGDGPQVEALGVSADSLGGGADSTGHTDEGADLAGAADALATAVLSRLYGGSGAGRGSGQGEQQGTLQRVRQALQAVQERSTADDVAGDCATQ